MSEDFTAEMPLPQKPQRRPTLRENREAERLSVGGFFAQHRSVIDERRSQLARVAMDPIHVEALRMPPLHDEPLPARGTRMPALPANGPEPVVADLATVSDTPVPAQPRGPKREVKVE